MVNTNVIVGILIAVALLPVIISTISDANFTGTVAVVMTLIPLFLALALLTKYSKGGGK